MMICQLKKLIAQKCYETWNYYDDHSADDISLIGSASGNIRN